MGDEGGTSGGWEYGGGRGPVGGVARFSNGSEIREVGEVGSSGGLWVGKEHTCRGAGGT